VALLQRALYPNATLFSPVDAVRLQQPIPRLFVLVF